MNLAMVFPGQGSQSVGMLSDLAGTYSCVTETFSEASDVLGYDLWKIVADGPEEKLNMTEVTQPAMLAAGVACWRVWQEKGGTNPTHLAGHSLGEYTALVCAGAISFADGVAAVAERARLMQSVSKPGESSMAAVIGLDDTKIRDICDEASTIGVAEAVNFNSPGQVVIAGHVRAVESVVELAKEGGARRAILLPVSVPSHSSIMRPAGQGLADFLAKIDIRDPDMPVISAMLARPYKSASDVRQILRDQVSSPVQWVQTTLELVSQGASTIVECGPGKVLSGLIRRIDKSIEIGYLNDNESLEKALALAA